MSLLHTFQEYNKREKLLLPGKKYLLAFSGGVDSVVLAELLFRSGISYSIAHVNFSLRGAESEEDQYFAEETAKRYRVPFFIKKFDTKTIASEQKKGIQETARELRYHWFEELLKQHDFNGVITAHHADDNIETVWINLLRGTGLQGLSGMSMKAGGIHGNLIRPLLFAQKKEIIEFAKGNDLLWREDSSNAHSDYTRNYLRNEILPMVQTVFPNASSNMLHNIERLRQANHLFEYLTEQYINKWLLVKGEELHIPVLKIIKTPGYAAMMYHLLSKYSFSSHQIQEATALIFADSGKYVQNENWRIIRNRAWLIIAPTQNVQTIGAVIEAHDKFVKTDSFELNIAWRNADISVSKIPAVATLNAQSLQFPLLIRKWKRGDYFYPFGMNKKKKLSDFFINQKLSISDKEKIWVLESANRIVWVMGMRIDNRFRITETTKEVVQLSFTQY